MHSHKQNLYLMCNIKIAIIPLSFIPFLVAATLHRFSLLTTFKLEDGGTIHSHKDHESFRLLVYTPKCKHCSNEGGNSSLYVLKASSAVICVTLCVCHVRRHFSLSASLTCQTLGCLSVVQGGAASPTTMQPFTQVNKRKILHLTTCD